MPRKVKSAIPMQTKLPKLPFSVTNRGAFVRKCMVVVKKAGPQDFYVVEWDIASNLIVASTIPAARVSPDHRGTTQFAVDGHHTSFGPEGLVKTHLQWLKNRALQSGATPDAIRLLASAVKLTKKEEADMAKAEKLTRGKNASTKPVGKGGKVAAAKGGKKGGNPEALERARAASAARNAENAKQKLTVTAKLADVKLRGGRLAKFEWIVKNKPKTVGDALGTEVKDSEGETHKIDMGALRGMEKRGHIKIG